MSAIAEPPAADSPGQDPVPADPRRRRTRGSRWRAPVPAVLIVVASILVPVSVGVGWARTQLVDESAFVSAFQPLAADPAVQNLVTSKTMAAIDATVDFPALAKQLAGSLTPQGAGDLTTRALQALAASGGTALRGEIERGITSFVGSSAFSDLWRTGLVAAHRGLVFTATSDGGGVLEFVGGQGLVLHVDPLLQQIFAQLPAPLPRVAAFLPPTNRTVVLDDGGAVRQIRLYYGVTVTWGNWLPIVSLVLFALGIAIARRRWFAIAGAGAGILLGAGALVALLPLLRAQLRTGLPDAPGITGPALQSIFDAATGEILATSGILAALGALLLVGGALIHVLRRARRA